MATLKNEKKLAAINRENYEEYPGINQARDMNVPRIKKNYITQVSEEIEGRVTRSCPRISAEGRFVFRALSLNMTSFFWNRKLKFTLHPLRRHPGTQVETKTQLKIVPRMILILKQGFLLAKFLKIAAQTMSTTLADSIFLFCFSWGGENYLYLRFDFFLGQNATFGIFSRSFFWLVTNHVVFNATILFNIVVCVRNIPFAVP